MRQSLLLPAAVCVSLLLGGAMAAGPAAAAEPAVHLFILSGQSNMVGLNPDASFTPAVRQGLEGDEVIVVKAAWGGRSILRWYKKWEPAQGEPPASTGDLYDHLMKKVRAAIEDTRPTTITFVWMQGERDSWSGGKVYAAALKGLIDQLRDDMGRQDVNVVIGRLSDFDMGNKQRKHWTVVRDAQVQVAEADPRAAWVDTDDLNGPKDGLHYTKDGYKKLGERFARKALALLRAQKE